jgi:hypothetical protein
MGANERQALKAWVCTYEDFDYLSFATIAVNSGLERSLVRRTVRSMARKSVTQFCSGLSNDDGEFRGSGYGLTAFGRERHVYADENRECVVMIAASVDTLPKGRDAKQGSVRSKGSAVRDSADAPKVQP